MGSSTSHVEPNTERIPSARPTEPMIASHSRNTAYKVKPAGYGDAFVKDALQICNCASFLQVFVDNEIDKDAFLLLTEEDLKCLLPGKLGPTKKIFSIIQSLQKEAKHGTDSAETALIRKIPQATSSHATEEERPDESMALENLYLRRTPDRFEDMCPPVSALTKLPFEFRSKESSNFCELNALETPRSPVTPPPSQSVFNSLSLNVQFVNQHHNHLQTYNSVPNSSQFAEEGMERMEITEETQTLDAQMNATRKSLDRRPVKANHKDDKGTVPPFSVKQQNKRTDGAKKHYRPTSRNVPHSFRKDKQLPIYKYKDDFLRMVEQNAVVIVIAETGSGKSTQMPQYLARADYDKKIICTQPRRLAAKSLAKRVAFEFGTKMGQEVGYRVRFDNCTENTTKISYVTEGVLVHELATDVTASNYSVVIIDEAHERNLNTDVLLGCLKKAITLRPDLKVVISSATVEAKKFSTFFNHAPVLDIPGRSFPVEIVYTGNPDPDYLATLVDKVCRIHSANALGDILGFLPGQEEIEYVADTITSRIRERPNAFVKELVLPLYSKLPAEQQNLIFEPAPLNTRKIILATNIAETSLTIDGVVFVVDSGLVKQAEYMTKANGVALECTTLVTIPITKAQAKQRSGRAGRTQPGVAYRLYSEGTYNKMAESPIPEILRSNLEMVVLLLFSMGIKNLLKFDFLDSPPKDALLTALEKLQEFGALCKLLPSNEYSLTTIGRQMSGFPIEPYLSKMLIMSADLGCSEEMLTIIAMLSAQVDKLFKRPKGKKMEADLKKKTFNCPEGDHITLLKVYTEWLRNNSSRAWCKEFYLDSRTLEEVYEIRCQLATMLDEKNIARTSCGNDMTKIQIAIASGSFRKVAWKISRYAYFTYSSPRDEPVLIHPSSSLFSTSPNWVIYNSVIKTKKAYMSQVLEIESEYIERYASDFYSKLQRVMCDA